MYTRIHAHREHMEPGLAHVVHKKPLEALCTLPSGKYDAGITLTPLISLMFLLSRSDGTRSKILFNAPIISVTSCKVANLVIFYKARAISERANYAVMLFYTSRQIDDLKFDPYVRE